MFFIFFVINLFYKGVPLLLEVGGGGLPVYLLPIEAYNLCTKRQGLLVHEDISETVYFVGIEAIIYVPTLRGS